jgi:DNA-binding transcriptional LysR family regulator
MGTAMNLTIKQLRAFVVVAELESFRLAAQRLHLTPGAVSIVVKELEREVGFALFDRTTRRVSVSKQGREFLLSARRALQALQQAEIAAQDVRIRASGIVQLVTPAIISNSVIPPVLAAFLSKEPGVSIRPVDCPSKEMVALVDDDRADIAIGPARPTTDRVQRIKLQDCPWGAWCLPQHPVHRKRTLTWKALMDEPLILAGTDPEAVLAEAFSSQAKLPAYKLAYAVENMTTALGLSSAGLGVTVAPTFVGVMAARMGLKMKPLHGPVMHRELSAYISLRRAPTPAIAAFLAFVRMHFSCGSPNG